MNKQRKNGIEWTDYTWNPVAGCFHDCRWEMPDGSIAECYAKTVAENVATSAYPKGFANHYWHPHRLNEPLRVKSPSKIFLDSMSDLMGHWVSDEQVEEVLDICRQANWHQFQLLTKYAPRLEKFKFPANVWVGASVPPTFMYGKRLTQEQQSRMLSRTLAALKNVDAHVKWMSVEPLSRDIATEMADCGLQWVVIGAATNGRKTYQPKREWVQNLLDVMDEQGIPVFFKGNLRWTPWRECFPITEHRLI
ncbi:MAG: hypothetical protein CUN55_00485 [Phototrophicales bacterium]|nr:MAG: hypothetical protein CUN55_00485 [Phototrophicales bacterium]